MNVQNPAGSSHHLSRAAVKIRARPDTAESYAVDFFQTHPDVTMDKRSPNEKLEEVIEQLHGELHPQDRFHLLIQKKSLCYLVYGETSAEYLECLHEIGRFYLDQDRPSSAMRHLSKAQEMAQSVELSDADTLSLATSVAEAYLRVPSIPRQELTRQLTVLEGVLNRYANIDTDDRVLTYHRDLMLARIYARRGRWTEAMIKYQSAAGALSEINEGKATEQTAQLDQEMAEAAEAANDSQTATKMYRRAHSTFLSLGLHEMAKPIEQKTRAPARTESDDEDDAQHPPAAPAEDARRFGVAPRRGGTIRT
jgi:tetratricopeptide (TPR) repeat protein